MDTIKKLLSGRVSLIHIESLKDIPFRAYFTFAVAFVIVGIVWAAPEWRKDVKEALFGAKPAITGDPPNGKKEAAAPIPMPAPKSEPAPGQTVEPPKIGPPPAMKEARAPVPEPKEPPKVYGFIAPPLRGVDWKTLEIGSAYSSPKSALKALDDQHVFFPDSVERALRRAMSASISKESSVLSVAVTPADLGFSEAATLSEIVKRATAFELRPFPADAIPAAALAYEGTRRMFFAAQVAPREYQWKAVVALGKEDGRTNLSLIEWHGFVERNFDHEQTFHPNAILLFSRR